MFGNTTILSLMTVGLSICMAHAIEIETVPVGNLGNAADTRYETPGYGAVAYEYNIGKYEVSCAQYVEFLNAVAVTDTYGLYNDLMWSMDQGCKIHRAGSSGNYTYSVATDRANRPVNYVGWADAARFANWLANGQPTGAQDLTTTEDGAYFLDGAISETELMSVTRQSDAVWFLPTEDEWYKAAYHKNDGVTGNYWDYPTGTDSEPSNDLINPDPGNNANFYVAGGDFTIRAPYYMTEVGEFENSQSPYGTFDQGGNSCEWNETLVFYSCRGWLGGSWQGLSNWMKASDRDYLDPTGEWKDTGFRVASIF